MDIRPSLTPSGQDLMVRPARVVACRRQHDDRPSEGDEAVAELDPGLLRFLSLADPSGVPLGEGGSFAWTIPIGVAATAGYAVLEPVAGVNFWTGVKNTVRFHRHARAGETLIATCRLTGLGVLGETPYFVWSREEGDLIVEGVFLASPAAVDEHGMYAVDLRETPAAAPAAQRAPPSTTSSQSQERSAPMLDAGMAEIARPTDDEDLARLNAWSATAPARIVPGEPVAAAVLALRRPRVLRRDQGSERAVWEWLFPRDLLRLLLHPLAGGQEPLGRRHHPFGRVLEGMAIHATLKMTGAVAPAELSAGLTHPLRGDDDFRVRARLRPSPTGLLRVDHEIYEGERAVARVRVTVAAPALPPSGNRPSHPAG